jgi:hypothetical protein
LAGLAIVGLGGLAYLLVALDPLDVVLVLAERGGSPALFGVGVGMIIGAALVALGSLGLATRDIRLDPRHARDDQPPIAKPAIEQSARRPDPR